MTEHEAQLRAALSPLDFGHDYLATEELRLMYDHREQGIPTEVTARAIAARRHLEDRGLARWRPR